MNVYLFMHHSLQNGERAHNQITCKMGFVTKPLIWIISHLLESEKENFAQFAPPYASQICASKKLRNSSKLVQHFILLMFPSKNKVWY